MFGDPVTNPKGWKVRKLGDVGDLARGKSKHRPRNDPVLLGGPYPLVQTGEITNAKNYLKNYNQTYSEAGLKQSKMWPAGTLCITIAANIAETAILTFDACFPDSVVGFKPSDEVRIEYVHYWMTFLQEMIERDAPESAQKNINLKILNDLDIPIPSTQLQEQFSIFFKAVEALRKKSLLGYSRLDNLFHALQQRAFRGEL